MSGERVLLVDCGTSRLKSAWLEPGRGEVTAAAELPSPAARRGERGAIEVDAAELGGAFRKCVELAAEGAAAPSAIWLCSEMHGFVLDDGRGRALSAYIGWRDERAALDGAPSTLERFKADLGPDFQNVTGMAPRPGLPALVLAHLAKGPGLPPGARLLSLPEWLAVSQGDGASRTHVSMAAASGLYDIVENQWSKRLIEYCGVSRLARNDVVEEAEAPIGAMTIRGRRVPLLGGVGDMQAAMLGAGIPERSAMAINIGTGSQAARQVAKSPRSGERRPFFQGSTLRAVTHIPAGRALDALARLIDGFVTAAGGRSGILWERLARLRAEDILAAPHQVDLNLFSAAWKFGGGGTISGLLEDNCSAGQFTASIARGWMSQYREAADSLDPLHEVKRIALAGGLARRMPWAVPVMRELLQRDILPAPASEEALLGLARLAAQRIH